MTEATDLVTRTQDVLTVRRVFGEAIERNGVTVVPVVRFAAGGGAGSGDGGRNGSGGSGGGYGLKANPAGVFVIRDGAVQWRPAVDVNRVVLGAQLVAIIALLTLRQYLKLRARRTSASAPMRAAEWGDRGRAAQKRAVRHYPPGRATAVLVGWGVGLPRASPPRSWWAAARAGRRPLRSRCPRSRLPRHHRPSSPQPLPVM